MVVALPALQQLLESTRHVVHIPDYPPQQRLVVGRRRCRFGEHSLPILQSAKPKAALLDPSVFILSTSTAAIAKAQNSSSCIHTCGSGKSAKTVRYPFGFSPGCQIRLNCSENNKITLGKFRVQNVTQTPSS
ncbi:hypothetical protein ACFX1R_004705 [Malus domestica]